MNLTEKLKTLVQASAFKWKMGTNRFRGLPAQTHPEIRLFKKIFNYIGSGRQPVNVFEWGSGYSSIYYAKYLKGCRVNFKWHSLDNNPVWHAKVKEMADQAGLNDVVRFYIKAFPPFWEKPGWGAVPPPCGRFAPEMPEERDYIRFPVDLGIKFNVVIVDARFRRRCLQTAGRILTDDGLVILHDAQKPHYHEGTGQYPCQAFFSTGAWYPFQDPQNKVWVGSFGNAQAIRLWQQQVATR